MSWLHVNDSADLLCFTSWDAKERAERLAGDECPYEIIPSAQMASAIGEEKAIKPVLPGYQGKYDVDCKQAQ